MDNSKKRRPLKYPKPNPKASADGIDERFEKVLEALAESNTGPDAEYTGLSAKTLNRRYLPRR